MMRRSNPNARCLRCGACPKIGNIEFSVVITVMASSEDDEDFMARFEATANPQRVDAVLSSVQVATLSEVIASARSRSDGVVTVEVDDDGTRIVRLDKCSTKHRLAAIYARAQRYWLAETRPLSSALCFDW